MRKGPGTNYPVIRKLALGQTVTVVSIDRYGWAKQSNGYYVSSLYLKRDTGSSSKDNNKSLDSRATILGMIFGYLEESIFKKSINDAE